MNCTHLVTRYIVLAVSEFLDKSDEDPEQIKFDNLIICGNCWDCIKGNSRVLQNILIWE
jgi:hypothetical protein